MRTLLSVRSSNVFKRAATSLVDRPATLTNAVLLGETTAEKFDQAEAAIAAATRSLAAAEMDRADAPLIRAEFANAAAMMRHACDTGRSLIRGTAALSLSDAILAEHRRLWLARNRSGGLEDSIRWFA